MRHTIDDYMTANVITIRAAGTSEGAAKGWDTRGRGRKGKPKMGRKALVRKYDSLHKAIGKAAVKLESAKEVKTLAGKCLHFLRALGDFIEPYRNLKDLVIAAGVGVWGVMHEFAAHSAAIHGVLTWAMAHIAPVMNHVQTTAGLFN